MPIESRATVALVVRAGICPLSHHPPSHRPGSNSERAAARTVTSPKIGTSTSRPVVTVTVLGRIERSTGQRQLISRASFRAAYSAARATGDSGAAGG